MKIKLLALLLALPFGCVSAQEYSSSFNVLNLPASSHVAALGGRNITLLEDNPAIGWSNPARYADVSDKKLSLSFMSYAAGSSWMGAHFTKAFGERHTMAVGVQYMNYGSMDETDEWGQTIGDFNAKDIVLGVGYSYLFSDRWTGGAMLKGTVSNLADYTAATVSVDLGLNYYDEEQDLSVSAALRNIGTQVNSYDGYVRTHLPFSLDLGFSQGMAHLPVRIHATLTDLTRWKSSYYALPEPDSKQPDLTRKLLNHLVLGLDILPSETVYLALGYNFRHAYELKAAGSSHWAGLSAGGGINLQRFQFGIAYTQYHQSTGSLMVSAAYRL